jgi:hypothetical protein
MLGRVPRGWTRPEGPSPGPHGAPHGVGRPGLRPDPVRYSPARRTVSPDFDTVIAKAQVGGGAPRLFVPTFP